MDSGAEAVVTRACCVVNDCRCYPQATIIEFVRAEYQLVLTTCPDVDVAERVARALVAERLAACVNILPPMRSIYRWHGTVETATEHLLIIKIRAHDFDAVGARIGELHSYELPEVIAVPIAAGSPPYLAWLDNPDRVR